MPLGRQTNRNKYNKKETAMYSEIRPIRFGSVGVAEVFGETG
jgi:hypothetical protein